MVRVLQRREPVPLHPFVPFQLRAISLLAAFPQRHPVFKHRQMPGLHPTRCHGFPDNRQIFLLNRKIGMLNDHEHSRIALVPDHIRAQLGIFIHDRPYFDQVDGIRLLHPDHDLFPGRGINLLFLLQIG